MIDAGVKRCSCCKSIKNVDQFCKNRVSYDGLSNTCKECTKKIGKEYNLSDKGAITQAKFLLKRHEPVDIELPPELIEARAELIKIRRTLTAPPPEGGGFPIHQIEPISQTPEQGLPILQGLKPQVLRPKYYGRR